MEKVSVSKDEKSYIYDNYQVPAWQLPWLPYNYFAYKGRKTSMVKIIIVQLDLENYSTFQVEDGIFDLTIAWGSIEC